MAQEPEQIKTTLGTRISTGAVNAAFGGAVVAGTYASMTGIAKMVKMKGASAMKFATPGSWKVAGLGAAAMGLYGFVTADRAKEVAKEKAMADYMDPTKGSEKERSAAFDKQWDAIDKGDLSNLKQKSATHFQDKISASRAAAEQAQAR